MVLIMSYDYEKKIPDVINLATGYMRHACGVMIPLTLRQYVLV